ncbi:hypothetical protein LY56_03169 [Roseinatronobacter thiooxidans]|uniref:PIN domain-containing protein n=1 Tax=Roseinatronobacter thiooxidans TaxID=121821 RepID=A0A2W7PP56_9RHOB|nr:PIN domain-containing protein [Roseinatronobacter thiooxidans]PZX37968.1 hypothetical protein LY56_03169 [Roseinatronobacter thiooxidans]
MIIIDTNVLSEFPRPALEPKVEAWLAAQDGLHVYLIAISEAEQRYGVAIMAKGRRCGGLAQAIDYIIREDVAGRVRVLESAAASAFADIAATRRAAGRPIAQSDCPIAAIACDHGASIIICNTADLKVAALSCSTSGLPHER